MHVMATLFQAFFSIKKHGEKGELVGKRVYMHRNKAHTCLLKGIALCVEFKKNKLKTLSNNIVL